MGTAPNNILWFISYVSSSFRMFAYQTYSEQNDSPQDVHILIQKFMNMLHYIAQGIKNADGISF